MRYEVVFTGNECCLENSFAGLREAVRWGFSNAQGRQVDIWDSLLNHWVDAEEIAFALLMVDEPEMPQDWRKEGF